VLQRFSTVSIALSAAIRGGHSLMLTTVRCGPHSCHAPLKMWQSFGLLLVYFWSSLVEHSYQNIRLRLSDTMVPSHFRSDLDAWTSRSAIHVSFGNARCASRQKCAYIANSFSVGIYSTSRRTAGNEHIRRIFISPLDVY
jgi:hypothetical protein